MITMSWIVLLGGCFLSADETDENSDSGEDTSGEDSALDNAVDFRAIGAGEFPASWDVVATASERCEEIQATLLTDQGTLDAWANANLPEQTLDGVVDWSSEIVLAATLDCINGGHPLHLDSLVQEEALRASYVLNAGCTDTGTLTRDYVVVAIPSTVTGSLDATWSILQDTDC